ncbi:MAG: DUF4331 domain-containing protein [Candidatus Eremiobacteraeota bacterium]|nr:DUF4331 domain-containing protein [Candidatus Eremiobacteraeota bacterium]
MKPILPILAVTALAGAVALYAGGIGRSSDHQDSPTTVARPGADITDVYVFPAADPNKVVLAMDVHPLIPAGQGTTKFFDPGVMYQLKIDTNNDFHEDKVIQFRVTGEGADQRIAMSGPAAPSAPGTTSTWVGSAQSFGYNHVAKLSNGMMAFAGPRQDPFYFDLAQFFKIVPDRNVAYHAAGASVPAPSATCFRKPGVDFLRNYNVLSLIAEVPRAMLVGPGNRLGLIHVYATTSLMENGRWTQVERLGRPAIKEAFQQFARHDATNRSAPWNDPYLPKDIVSFMRSGAHRSSELATNLEKVLIPDELAADLSQAGPARYLSIETKGKSALPTAVVRIVPEAGLLGIKKSLGNPYRLFGGRDFSSPVMDLSLGVIFGTLGQKVGLAHDMSKDTPCLTSDNVQPTDRGITAGFPYAGRPV